jgi:protein gp37
MTNDNSRIEWTDATWNPTTGCSKVSVGCVNCYAEAVSTRWGITTKPWTHPHAAENVVLHPERLDQPLRWRKPRRIFVDSMSNLFHEQVPDDYIDQVFGVMAGAKQHTFQVLTKRPERMRRYLEDPQTKYRVWAAGRAVALRSETKSIRYLDWYDVVPVAGPGRGPDWCYPARWPLPNVWLGTSVEDQRVAGRVIDLVRTPAAVRFLSCEPLICPLDLTRIPVIEATDEQGTFGVYHNALTGHCQGPDDIIADHRVHWVIVGGESGPNHRPIDPEWVRSLRDQCTAAGTAFFFKQWGGRFPKEGGRELDGQVWDQMPETARIGAIA